MLYYLFKGIEYIGNFIRMKSKILYWKLKYGKRIKIGKHLKFRKRFHINITNEGYLEIGNNNFFNNDCSINCHEKIIIGNDNLFGENVRTYDHNHVFNNKNIDMKKNFTTNVIEIGNCNWICTNVVILKQAKIGNYNVIGAGKIVSRKYDDDNIIKTIEDNEIIQRINYR